MTKSKKIVFTTWGSFGDIHPFMALALELQARGHRAAIATLAWYRDKIEAAGLQFYPLRPDELSTNKEEEDEVLRRIMDLRDGPRYVMQDLLSPHIRASYQDTLRAVLDERRRRRAGVARDSPRDANRGGSDGREVGLGGAVADLAAVCLRSADAAGVSLVAQTVAAASGIRAR